MTFLFEKRQRNKDLKPQYVEVMYILIWDKQIESRIFKSSSEEGM